MLPLPHDAAFVVAFAVAAADSPDVAVAAARVAANGDVVIAVCFVMVTVLNALGRFHFDVPQPETSPRDSSMSLSELVAVRIRTVRIPLRTVRNDNIEVTHLHRRFPPTQTTPLVALRPLVWVDLVDLRLLPLPLDLTLLLSNN